MLLLLALLLPHAVAAQEKGYLGVQIQDVTADEAKALGWEAPRAAKVVAAVEGGPGAQAGLLAGDIIVSIDGVEIATARGLADAISGKPPGAEVTLRLLREGRENRIKLPLGVRPASLDEPSKDTTTCRRYMPSVGKTVEVPCAPEG